MRKTNKILLSLLMGVGVFFSFNTQEIKASDNISYLDTDTIDGIPIHRSIISYSENHRPGFGMTPKYITVHNTANPDYGADAAMHSRYLQMGQTDESAVSWHFTVDNNEIYQHLPLNEVGYHAGDGGGQGNFASIGIEICENADGNYAQAEQNTIKLVAEILYENDMDISQVVPHQHWSGKDCPHNLLHGLDGSVGWDTFINSIQKEYDNIILKNSKTKTPDIFVKTGENISFSTLFNISPKNYTLTKNDKKVDIQENLSENVSLILGTGDYYMYKTIYEDKGLELNENIALDELDITKYIKSEDKSNISAISSNSDILEVKDNQLITKGEGNVFLTIKQNDKEVRLFIKVENKKQLNIIKKNNIVNSLSGIVPMFVENKTETPIWKSDNSDVLSLDENGNAVANKTGKAQISVEIEGKIFNQTIIVE